MPRSEPSPPIGLPDGARTEAASPIPSATIGPPLAVGLLGLVVAGAALLISIVHGVPWLAIVGEQLVGLSYIAAGTVAWLRRPGNAIGPAIVGAGITWFIADFVLVPVAGITALAYALMWIPNLFAAFILLTYPTGRFFSEMARRLFVIGAAVSVVQYGVRLFVLDSSPDYGCTCQNPFALLPSDPVYDAVMLVTRILAVLITLAILVLIVRRWRHSTSAGRRQLSPVLFAGIVGLAAFAGDITAYNVGAHRSGGSNRGDGNRGIHERPSRPCARRGPDRLPTWARSHAARPCPRRRPHRPAQARRHLPSGWRQCSRRRFTTRHFGLSIGRQRPERTGTGRAALCV